MSYGIGGKGLFIVRDNLWSSLYIVEDSGLVLEAIISAATALPRALGKCGVDYGLWRATI